MDAEEKLLALKKAYADIILNISKEAAARVMSSERRAMRYQHELKVAKEEALRMALRLKQMMDSRTSEAEAAALDRQKKIEVLEAQLDEAEDIVKDLREELGEKQAEMERKKSDILKNINDCEDANSRELVTGVQLNSGDEFAIASDRSMPSSQRNECSKCYHNKKVCMCGSYVSKRDLPSIILRNKEPGLYRNGCTQRIHACERIMLDKELSLSGETDNLKNKNNSEEQEEDEDTSKLRSWQKNQSAVESKLLADIKLSSFPPFHRKRKRATRRRKTVTALNRKPTDPFEKPDQFPELSSKHIAVEENTHSSENPCKIAETCAESSGGRVPQKDEGLKETVASLGERTGFSESLSSPVCKVDVGNLDVLSNGVESNSSDKTKGLSSQPVRERVIKYTFQRKRKRGALSGCEMIAPPDGEKRAKDTECGYKNVEASNSSMLVETSRDNRRLAQVARQLISLSEKKWWH